MIHTRCARVKALRSAVEVKALVDAEAKGNQMSRSGRVALLYTEVILGICFGEAA